MPISIAIPDESLEGYSPQAKLRVEEAARSFANDLIDEANRLESGRNFAGGAPEVTGGMVNDANDLLRRGLYAPPKSWKLKALRIVAAVLPLIVGILYDRARLQDGLYLLIFIVVVSGTILAVTLSILKE